MRCSTRRVGNAIPRHWVLIVGRAGEILRCYEPSSGDTREVDLRSVRCARLTGLGFRRPFGFALPVRVDPPLTGDLGGID